MPTAQTIISDFIFSLSNITGLQILDIALVALVYFLLLNLLRRSRATVLLRGMMVLLVIFFVVAVFLPLPTFDYILELALIATLIAIPIIFQPELRRLLEELGRRVGSLGLQRAAAETALSAVSSTLETLASRRTGALIVLEGNDDLTNIMQTGVQMNSRVTSELLQTIFFDGTPLHDGAVIIRGDRVAAAGCVLPVSNRSLYSGPRRLGTRHRAAMGLAETSDALVLVVSEETGAISAARDGRLQTNLEKTALREQIHNFFSRGEEHEEGPVLRRLWEQLRQWLVSSVRRPARSELLPTLALLVTSLILALGTWAFVIQETNPIRQVRVEKIPVEVTGTPADVALETEPPQDVTAVVKAPNAIIDSLGPGTFQAQVSLAGITPGLRRVPIMVESSVRPVQIVSISPAIVDLQLAKIITRSVEVRVDDGELQLPSPALELGGTPVVTPTQVVISGAAPLAESVEYARVPLPEVDVTGTIVRTEPVTLVGGEGVETGNLNVEPERVQVGLEVVRRANAREVGVQVLTTGVLPSGYRLVSIGVEPDRVTLLGSADQLDEVGTAIATLPVDISQIVEDFSIQVPLNLPAGVDAVNPEGETVRSVLVSVEVDARTGNRLVTRQVRVEGSPGVNLQLNPPSVEVLIRGPLPTLRDIETEPRLVRVVVRASQLAGLQPGESVVVTPIIIAPEDV
ncbi:MAG TPA: diadenylate cyclase CdaA, partial [Candidatus Binatia bacterium]|nr:diadenylate cyclase CdaA [Candidatus Binatia bacterium]